MAGAHSAPDLHPSAQSLRPPLPAGIWVWSGSPTHPDLGRALCIDCSFSWQVVDGTPCSPDSSSVCVQGRCIHAGCDRVIGSKKKFDKCMVCGGDGSSCTKQSGSFRKFRYGYNNVVTIPAGATHILVRQQGAPGVRSLYLALKLPDGSYALNGEYTLMPSPTDVVLPG
ncbi:A disintegrin and metalloproteinase with thrombospondin motifs 4-like, partial [Ursus maritimus]|uniref:A disintegrin and metalloproteinase with thrombospondin motifs 4-like n=1 Tax=Ursus maritimus TaxID=29073 RepID=A0A384DLB1_URSMA